MRHHEEGNCNSYGTYEIPGESPTASLCNGGWYDRKRWDTCSVKENCRIETRGRAQGERVGGRVTLPTISSSRGSRTIASTPNLNRGITRASRSEPAIIPVAAHDSSNPYLSTERAPHQMGPSPTFIPKKKEGVVKRLSKNIAQGWIAGLGWHLFDMAQQVDMFPEEDEENPEP